MARWIICRACQQKRRLCGRGLCKRCHRDQEKRSRFGVVVIDKHEPTSAEVEAVVVEQSKRLPRW